MSDFYKELVAKMTDPMKQRPYKESSLKPVYSYLVKLNGGSAPTSLDFLLDRPVVLKFLEKYAVGTQRSIIFTLRNIARDFKREDILEVWKENIEETEAGKGLPPKNEKSEAQEKAYALVEGDDKGSAWESVLKRVESNKSPVDSLDYIVPKLYTMFPPRRNLDYTEMKLCESYDDTLSKEFNYLVVKLKRKRVVVEEGKPKRVFFTIEMDYVFNRYKTDGVYSQQVFNVPEDLVSCWRHYIKANQRKDGDFLLRRREKLRSDDITDILHKVIGAGISTQMLRHMYLDKYNTPENEKVVREMMGDADKMSHSISTQQNIYVKK